MYKAILRHKAVLSLSLASFLLVAGGSLWAYVTLRTITGSPLILHFDDLSGITAIGGTGSITFMGVLGTIIVIMNFFIAFELAARDRFLAAFTAAATLVFAVLLFAAFSAIIRVNY